MAVTDVVDGIIDLIKLNIIAKTDIISDASIGDTTISVANSFHFERDQEIVLIDYGYNTPGDPHYHIFEYARIKQIIDTRNIELYDPLVSDWTVANSSFIQKTIGHDPLYSDNVYYGDRAVIPTESMSVTVEPLSMSNEWIYLMGGLSEEYRMSIMIYGKDIETEEGMKILNKYTDAIYKLMMSDLHPDINNYDTPVLYDVPVGASTVIIADTENNREQFAVGTQSLYTVYRTNYDIQDNINVEQGRVITNISPATYVPGGEMTITVDRPFDNPYLTSEYAAFTRHGRYFYDSRIDNIEYGTVQKGSAFIRAARLNWFGKEVEEQWFPQHSKGIEPFDEVEESSSSSGP
jgi:hypothetical protein